MGTAYANRKNTKTLSIMGTNKVAIARDGDKFYTFNMDCKTETDGTVRFQVLAPETISGVSGVVSDNTGKITFDDKVLLFEPIADGILTPVSAPWFFIRGLKSGYIDSCMDTENGYCVQFQDNHSEMTIIVSVNVDKQNIPTQAQIIWDGMQIVSMRIEGFTIL